MMTRVKRSKHVASHTINKRIVVLDVYYLNIVVYLHALNGIKCPSLVPSFTQTGHTVWKIWPEIRWGPYTKIGLQRIDCHQTHNEVFCTEFLPNRSTNLETGVDIHVSPSVNSDTALICTFFLVKNLLTQKFMKIRQTLITDTWSRAYKGSTLGGF